MLPRSPIPSFAARLYRSYMGLPLELRCIPIFFGLGIIFELVKVHLVIGGISFYGVQRKKIYDSEISGFRHMLTLSDLSREVDVFKSEPPSMPKS